VAEHKVQLETAAKHKHGEDAKVAKHKEEDFNKKKIAATAELKSTCIVAKQVADKKVSDKTFADNKIAEKKIAYAKIALDKEADAAAAAAGKKLADSHKPAIVHKPVSGVNKGKTVTSKKPAVGHMVE
jgi:hypothetical protein